MKKLDVRLIGLALCSVLWVGPVLAADQSIAVYRPSTATWYCHRTDGSGYSVQWGLPGDVPVAADYLMAGGPQIAVYRPTSGDWFIRAENGTGTHIQWGTAGDVPCPGDYLGLGRPQVAIYRPATGQWFIRQDDGTAVVRQWGGLGDVPVLIKPAYAPPVSTFPFAGMWAGKWDDGQGDSGSVSFAIKSDGGLAGGVSSINFPYGFNVEGHVTADGSVSFKNLQVWGVSTLKYSNYSGALEAVGTAVLQASALSIKIPVHTNLGNHLTLTLTVTK